MPRAKSTSRAQGNTARAAGEGFESTLMDYHQLLKNMGLAVVDKTGPMVRMRKDVRMGQLVAQITGPGVADYVGCLSDGRFVGFEAKSTSDEQGFTLPEKSMHQMEWLLSIDRMLDGKAFVFYLVEWRAHGHVCLHWARDVDGRRIRYGSGMRIDGVQWYDYLTWRAG